MVAADPEFLKIAREYWPALLEEIHRSSPARHHNAMLDVFTRSLAASPADRPVIVAGSTGTRPSTARLIATVAQLPHGAVVLPGLDHAMRRSHWQALAEAATTEAIARWPRPDRCRNPEPSAIWSSCSARQLRYRHGRDRGHPRNRPAFAGTGNAPPAGFPRAVARDRDGSLG
jgi:inactivated superfamily I helicase